MHNITPKTLFIGRKIIFLPTCHSTNDIAAKLLNEETALEGTIIVTNQQTAGRGQRGNRWEAEPGKNLTFSLVLHPGFLQASEQFQLNIAISLGVHDWLSRLTEKNIVKIKWPNDIYFRDRKMGGILIENTLKNYQLAHSIVGIGLNINQVVFGDAKAISLKEATTAEQDFALPHLLTELLEALEHRYLQLRSGQQKALGWDYLDRLYWFEEERTFQQGDKLFSGRITGIDPTGKLLIASEGQTKRFDLKEVSFVC